MQHTSSVNKPGGTAEGPLRMMGTWLGYLVKLYIFVIVSKFL